MKHKTVFKYILWFAGGLESNAVFPISVRHSEMDGGQFTVKWIYTDKLTYLKPLSCCSGGSSVGRNNSKYNTAFSIVTSNGHKRGRHSSNISWVDSTEKYLKKNKHVVTI
jgi:hypothetical protein